MKIESFKKLNKGHLYGMVGLALTVVAQEAFATEGTTSVVDSAAALSPLLDKVLGSLSGTLGKVIMALGLVLSGTAGLAGMNKAVVFTPIGVGLMLGNAKTIVNWMFVG